MKAPGDSDDVLLGAALQGDAQAATALTRMAADLAWTACAHITRDRAETEAAFRDVMTGLQANGFVRLKGYDGRARLSVYITLVVRDLLSERVVKLLAIDADRGWRAFEAFFCDDMRRMIQRMLPGNDHHQNREDAFQSVCEALLKNDMQRLRAYSGRGSPSGFILHVIENLIIDYIRTIAPRRRLPAAIQRLPELDQSVFRLVYWEGIAADPKFLCARLTRNKEAPSAATVADSIGRIRATLPAGYRVEARGQGQEIDISAADEFALASGAEDFSVTTPEDNLVEREAAGLLEGALAAIEQALPRLEPTERLYLQLALTGQPAREIARMLGVPVETIHKLAQRVKKRLRQEIGDEAAVKNWRLSV